MIWANGFDADLSWVRLPVTDASGRPIRKNGTSPVPGIHFLGLPWLRKRKSGLICGIAEDARVVAADIIRQRSATG